MHYAAQQNKIEVLNYLITNNAGIVVKNHFLYQV